MKSFREDSCDNCHKHQAMHGISKGNCLCCECYVKAGNPPADWHVICIATYNMLNGIPFELEDRFKKMGYLKEA